MRQYMAIFMMFVKSSFYKVLGILAAMAAAEGICFFSVLNRTRKEFAENEIGFLSPESVLADSYLYWLFAVFLLALMVLLSLPGRNIGGKQEYTLRRLAASEQGVFLLQAGCNTCFYVLFWAVQTFVAFAFCAFYIRTAGADQVTNQTLFLTFYRSGFLHALLPLESVLGWFRNFLWFLALGITTAYAPYCQRRGAFRFLSELLLVLGLWLFSRGIGNMTEYVVVIVASLAVSGIVLFRVFTDGREPG